MVPSPCRISRRIRFSYFYTCQTTVNLRKVDLPVSYAVNSGAQESLSQSPTPQKNFQRPQKATQLFQHIGTRVTAIFPCLPENWYFPSTYRPQWIPGLLTGLSSNLPSSPAPPEKKEKKEKKLPRNTEGNLVILMYWNPGCGILNNFLVFPNIKIFLPLIDLNGSLVC